MQRKKGKNAGGRNHSSVWVTDAACAKLREASEATGMKMCEIANEAILTMLGSGNWTAKIKAAKNIKRLEADLAKAKKALAKFK